MLVDGIYAVRSCRGCDIQSRWLLVRSGLHEPSRERKHTYQLHVSHAIRGYSIHLSYPIPFPRRYDVIWSSIRPSKPTQINAIILKHSTIALKDGLMREGSDKKPSGKGSVDDAMPISSVFEKAPVQDIILYFYFIASPISKDRKHVRILRSF